MLKYLKSDFGIVGLVSFLFLYPFNDDQEGQICNRYRITIPVYFIVWTISAIKKFFLKNKL
jgi:hypothetical protein